ncbi:lactate racemase domain-containing protein [Paenibacillus eucommiae]|uniref:LarA-like N-terminal domain-containing protein n=1 Tax=Paenibacillus eucommiae TaxID=1355755 RepID=A0ABS4IT35_9BACL|nr:lactate racemase domain-containing protein [Paenibacillus eucommiae]MBP1990732.1 hypothetical protein [Paenibacillus eucommiae]
MIRLQVQLLVAADGDYKLMEINLNYKPAAVQLPKVRRVRQKLEPNPYDAAEVLLSELASWLKSNPLPSGGRVAIAAGSRGISGISEIVTKVAGLLKAHHLHPFIVPAMGSHGGATAEGQREVLEHLGISESICGVPVISSMEVVCLGTSPSGVPVYTDRHAVEADAIIPINRVKLHTDYRGPLESGIMKMLSIGLGKQKGANSLHRMGTEHFSRLIPEVGQYVLEHAPVYCGIALIEDAHHQICHVELLAPKDILSREPQLLQLAKQKQAKLPSALLDVLVVGEIGKDINGDGMDPNVTGRFGVPGLTGESVVQKVVVLDLSEHTEGNACGIGLADITTAATVSKINFAKTYMNVITALVTNGARLPLIMQDDQDAIMAAAQTCLNVEPAQIRMAMIRNTNCLTDIWVSEPLWKDMEPEGLWEALSSSGQILFDQDGRLMTGVMN